MTVAVFFLSDGRSIYGKSRRELCLIVSAVQKKFMSFFRTPNTYHHASTDGTSASGGSSGASREESADRSTFDLSSHRGRDHHRHRTPPPSSSSSSMSSSPFRRSPILRVKSPEINELVCLVCVFTCCCTVVDLV